MVLEPLHFVQYKKDVAEQMKLIDTNLPLLKL